MSIRSIRRDKLRAQLFGGTALLLVLGLPCRITAQTVTNLSGTTNMTIASGQTLSDTQTEDTAYSGVLSGGGNFALSGTGFLYLGGSSTYTGSTILNGGNLEIESPSAINDSASLAGAPYSSGIVFNGGTLRVDPYQTLHGPITLGAAGGTIQAGGVTLGGSISGAGQLTLDNLTNVPVVLSGVNTYTGGTNIQSFVQISSSANIGPGPISINEGGLAAISSLSLNQPISITFFGSLGASTGAVLTVNGQVSGTGQLTIAGGTTILTNPNIYSGGTLIDGGTLGITAADNLPYSTIQSEGGGVLQTEAPMTLTQPFVSIGRFTIDTKQYDVTANSQISDDVNYNNVGYNGYPGALTKMGSGNLTLSAANTYTLGTTIEQGTLSISSPENINDAGVNANSQVLNTGYLNGLTFTGGTLRIGASMFLGEYVNLLSSAQAATANLAGSGGGTIDTNGFNLTLTGQAGGDGSLTKIGAGTLTLANSNFYSGGTIIEGGVLSVNSAQTGRVATGASQVYEENTPGALPIGTITLEGGTLLTTGPVTLTGIPPLQQAAPVTNPGNCNSGCYIIAAGPPTGSVTPAVPAVVLAGPGGTIDTMGNHDYVTGAIIGPGALTKLGTGTLTLSSANNSYSGGTNVNSGTLEITANNAAGTGTLAIAPGAEFSLGIYNQTVSGLSGGGAIQSNGGILTNTGSYSYTGSITSTAGFTQSGTSQQTLNGVSTFVNTQVTGGDLEIGDASSPNAILNSPVNVSGNGILSGHGTINGNVTNSGIVRPGGTIGTLTVKGNYVQPANGALAIELSPFASSRLAVSGTAALAGTLDLLPDAGEYISGEKYAILTAGNGITGRFSNVTQTGADVSLSETYFPNAVDVTVTIPDITPNEASVSNAVLGILPSTSAGAFQSGLIALASAASDPQQRTALAGTLGELRSDIATIDLANLTAFQNFIVQRAGSRMGLGSMTTVSTGLPGTFDVAMNDTDMTLFGPSGSNSAITVDQPSAYLHGYGVLGEAGGQSGFQDYEFQTGGIVAGVDAKVTDTTLVGAAVGYEHTVFHLSGDEGESNTIDTYRVSLYGSQDLATIDLPLTADAALGYAFNDYHDNDAVGLSGLGISQNSRHTGNELTAQGGLSHGFDVRQDLVTGALSIVPRVGIEYDNIQQNPYSTTGAADGLNLTASGSTLNALRSTLGTHADLKLTTHDGTVITPEVRASYLHDFMDTNVPLTQAFTGAPAAGFQVSGVHPGRDAALAGTGVNVGFSDSLSASIGYDAAVRSHELDHTVQVGVKYKW